MKACFRLAWRDINRLYGAACIYLVFALIRALLYMLLDSRHGPSLTIVAGTVPFREYLYFSMVTLMTLGYGDIAQLTRSLQKKAYRRSGASPRFAPGAALLQCCARTSLTVNCESIMKYSLLPGKSWGETTFGARFMQLSG